MAHTCPLLSWAIVPLLLFYLPPAAPISTCEAQQGCLKLAVTPLGDGAPCDGGCQFQACLRWSKFAECGKTDTVSHICKKSATQCIPADGFNFKGASTVRESWPAEEDQCQIGKGDSTLYFLVKDGKGNAGAGCAASPPATTPVDLHGYPAMCTPRPRGWSSCTGNGAGVECVWAVKLPSCAAAAAGDAVFQAAGGDSDAIAVVGEEGSGGAAALADAIEADGNPPPATNATASTDTCTDVTARFSTYYRVDSGPGPACSLDQLTHLLATYHCYHPSPDCAVLVCDAPASIVTDIRARCLNTNAP